MARTVSKRVLVGLKQNMLRQLKDQGMLSAPLNQVLHESVMPWLLDKTLHFL